MLVAVPSAPSTSSAPIAFLLLLFIALLFMALPVILGVYVYRDAKRRNMNAALWALVAVFAPALVGLIIYLIVRVDSAQCPACKAPVSESFAVCPNCATALQEHCPSCGFRAEPAWKVCPSCAAELPAEGRVSAVPYRRDRGVGKILVAVILVPVLLFTLLVAGMIMFRGSGGAHVSLISTTSDVRKEDYSGNNTVQSWLSRCEGKPDGAYVLYTVSGEDGSIDYLVYLKGYALTGLSVNSNSGGIFGKPYVDAKVYGRTEEAGFSLFYLETRSIPPMDLQLSLNGKQLEYESEQCSVSIRPEGSREAEKEAAQAQSGLS